MLTTCPECHTTFRVTQEHLGLRRGLVRCGHCGVVFNAYDTLLAELVTPPDEADQTAAPELDTAPDGGEVPELAVAAVPIGEPEAPATEPATPADQADGASTEINADVPAARVGGEETSESILLSELPTRIKPVPRPRSARFALQVVAALLLAGLLLLQIALFLRADLATALPATRPLLQSLCQPLGCTVPLPRQLDKAAIAASSLEHDAENSARARLTLLLANRTGQTQTWPYIVLTLTDVRDAPVAQRVFAPREYLARGSRIESGMAAREEQEIRLDLDIGTLAATGYALDLAYR